MGLDYPLKYNQLPNHIKHLRLQLLNTFMERLDNRQ
jgi:hypothetical protein